MNGSCLAESVQTAREREGKEGPLCTSRLSRKKNLTEEKNPGVAFFRAFYHFTTSSSIGFPARVATRQCRSRSAVPRPPHANSHATLYTNLLSSKSSIRSYDCAWATAYVNFEHRRQIYYIISIFNISVGAETKARHTVPKAKITEIGIPSTGQDWSDRGSEVDRGLTRQRMK